MGNKKTPRAGPTPTEAKLKAEAKLRAREARRLEMGGPGPCAYEPKPRLPGTASDRARASSAFRSRTRSFEPSRDTMLRDVTLDLAPGQYSYAGKKVPGGTITATPVGNSFAKSALRGANAFGSHSMRTLKCDILGGSTRDGYTPAPSTYEVSEVMGRGSGAYSAFRSTSRRIPKSVYDDLPGPYWPLNFELVYPRVVDTAYTMRTKTDRFRASMGTFTHQPQEASSHVGPGAYNTQMLPNGTRSTMFGEVQREAEDKGRSASFKSESVRDLTQKYFGHYGESYY